MIIQRGANLCPARLFADVFTSKLGVMSSSCDVDFGEFLLTM
jgi:hypothetical protein